jgi:hypothetical protein
VSDAEERIWWARARAAADRKGNAGSKLMSDWSHDWLAAIAERHPRGADFPCTDPDVLAEQRRVTDQLGIDMGVGPMPA